MSDKTPLQEIELAINDIKHLCENFNDKLAQHTDQDTANFAKIDADLKLVNTKIDNLIVKVTTLETLQTVASQAGADSGRKWGAAAGTLISSVLIGLFEFLKYLGGN